MSAHKVDPWKYVPIGSDPSTTLLYKKKYADIKARDFYNIDCNVIPCSIDPSKIYLYRYLRYEPYFYEMFDLNKDMHPFHPLHPTTEEIQKMTNKLYFTTRNPMRFPLKERKAGERQGTGRVERRWSDEQMDVAGAMFAAGVSETDTHLSPDDLQSSRQSSDAETGSMGTLHSWKYCDPARGTSPRSEQPASLLEGTVNVRQLWQAVLARPRIEQQYSEELGSLNSLQDSPGRASSEEVQEKDVSGLINHTKKISSTVVRDDEQVSGGSRASKASLPSTASEKEE